MDDKIVKGTLMGTSIVSSNVLQLDGVDSLVCVPGLGIYDVRLCGDPEGG